MNNKKLRFQKSLLNILKTNATLKDRNKIGNIDNNIEIDHI